MTRMIERWFPSAEVSACSAAGWGSGNQERNLMTWFAARPTAQAKAAVICSLLPWPDDESEQLRLQDLVRRAMTGRYAAWDELRTEIDKANPGGASVLDPFSGRGIIPLEAARLGLETHALDYLPVPYLASRLLIDFPFRDWTGEPPLPYEAPAGATRMTTTSSERLLADVEAVMAEVGRRHVATMAEFYPPVNGEQPWAYLWAVTLPCQECGHRFPLLASLELRRASIRKGKKGQPDFHDPGQSFYIHTDKTAGTYEVVVHDGPPKGTGTLVNTMKDGKKVAGKLAVCPFCQHTHSKDTHQRLTADKLGEDALLVVAMIDAQVGKSFLAATGPDQTAAGSAQVALRSELGYTPLLPAKPHEGIAYGNGVIVRPYIYGADTYGDLMCDRQTLSFVRLARAIGSVADELAVAGLSPEYVKALSGYAAAAVVRKLKRATRGATLEPGYNKIGHIFVNESSIAFSYDFLETGIGDGPGSWESITSGSISTLAGLVEGLHGEPAQVQNASARVNPLRSGSITAVVTDPPYDEMVAYGDASDLLYVWLKRCLANTWPELLITDDPQDCQPKTDEIIVKQSRSTRAPEGWKDHRDREHYDSKIGGAFAEMRRVVKADGLVTIVFGSGDVEVWQRLLSAIDHAGLILTGSWPANTESGGQQGKSNISTTLTMACRPAPTGRPVGRKGAIETAIKREIADRYHDWERWGLAPADMLMAAAGPAMEVVGRYSEILDASGEPVDIFHFLPVARAAVQTAMAVDIDHHPLETFDARTRFSLWWLRLYGRVAQAKSEVRWQTLSASLDYLDVKDLLVDADKGVRFAFSKQFKGAITTESPVIDVVLALAQRADDGQQVMGEVLAQSGRSSDDGYLWSAAKFIADRLPASDPDSVALHKVLRAKDGIASAAATIDVQQDLSAKRQVADDDQLRLL